MIGRMAILRVHLVPNAKSDGVAGEYGGAIKITVRAPAVDGKANAALIRFLAAQLKLLAIRSCWNAVTDHATN